MVKRADPGNSSFHPLQATGRNPGASGNIMTISIILAALAEGLIFIAIFLANNAS